eukprot:5511186-Amphidinium_carterae.2
MCGKGEKKLHKRRISAKIADTAALLLCGLYMAMHVAHFAAAASSQSGRVAKGVDFKRRARKA